MPKKQKSNKLAKLSLVSPRGVMFLVVIAVLGIAGYYLQQALSNKQAFQQLDNFKARPQLFATPLKKFGALSETTTPDKTKAAYQLVGGSGGSGTIAIVNAYDNPQAEADLNTFNTRFSLSPCTTSNGCFEKHKMATSVATNQDWALEESLDVQWAHAIAPNAKILLVEAKSNSGTDLLSAVDYARGRSDVVAVSLSWGGNEFSSEHNFNSHFTTRTGQAIFAASGDNGTGVIWPASSPLVIGVGGTSLHMNSGGTAVASEIAWQGSGGGQSRYETMPTYQRNYGISRSNGKRAVPDVSYNADPNTGFPVYDSFGYYGSSGWFVVGGTSAGTPQWAAIQALGANLSNSKLYGLGASLQKATYFRDIKLGSNGHCFYYCTARAGYDFITGLGSPKTASF